MATLLIRRKSEFINSMREITVELDGKLLGSISDGEIREFTVSPGKHKLKSVIDWCSSPEIQLDIQETETSYIELSSFARNKGIQLAFVATPLIVMLAAFLISEYNLNSVFGYSLSLIALPPFIYLLYMLTFGRKKYLRLTLN